jgi:hypothetical protein
MTKKETLNFLQKLPICSINDIATTYIGIDELSDKFIEVPQGYIYMYDGNDVIDIGSNTIIDSGKNIILNIMGMGPCRGLIVLTTNSIYMGHLDAVNNPASPLTLNTIKNSLNMNSDDISVIYYVMGMTSFDCMLDDKCTFCDISTEVLDIINKNDLSDKVCIVEDFAYYIFSDKFGYDYNNDQFIVFPIHPKIKDRYITEYDYEWEKEEECYSIYDRIIRKRKNPKKYREAKKTCISCGYNVRSIGKGKFKCS